MARSPWIWQGNNARLLCSGDLLDSAGNVIGGGGGDVTIQTDLGTYPVGTTIIFTSTDLDLTGNSGTDTVTYAIKNSAVTLAKMANLADKKVIGNISGSTGVPTAVDVDTANTASAIVRRDSNGDFTARNVTASLIGIVYKATNTISASAIDWSLSNVHTKSIGSTDTTFTFSNTQDGQCITVIITSTTGTVTWPTVKWQNGSAPTQTANSTDVYTFVKAGSTFYGSYIPAVS
jgi:hypothetical protein